MIPVDRTSSDPFYRYQMPPLQAAHESSRTVLVNLEQVAKALYRDPSHILRYMGMSLGCKQVRDGARYLLNGNFEGRRLQCTVYDFVDAFVLCTACGSPETRFVAAGGLARSCSSCGAVAPQDAHRLNGVIAKEIEKSANQDTKYGSTSIAGLLREDDDVSERLHALFVQEGLAPADLFSEYFRPSCLKQFSRVFAGLRTEEILEGIEGMLESHRKDDKIQSFLKALCRMGYSVDEIDGYFATPRRGRKRSPLIKKNAEHFIASFDSQ